jgi:hypothetical protein
MYVFVLAAGTSALPRCHRVEARSPISTPIRKSNSGILKLTKKTKNTHKKPTTKPTTKPT